MHALVAVLALAMAAQADTPDPTTSLVHVFVTATDARGRSVDDLDADDFRILEGGVPRQVESVRLVRAGGTPAPGETPPPILTVTDERTEAAREGTRVIGIFLDEYHLAPGASTDVVREALLELVDARLGPRDLVVLLRPLDSLLRIRATRDLEAVRAEIAAFEGRKGLLEPRSEFEENFIAASPERIEAVRSQIATSALNALVAHLDRLPGGRKAIVVASEGFELGTRRRGELLPTVSGVIRLSHRAGVVIHALDPRPEPVTSSGTAERDGVTQGAAPSLPGRDVLRELVEGTDGLALFGPTAWRESFGQVAAGLNHYYVVGFQSGAPGDGRFHEIDVAVARPAVVARAPAGYWTDSPLERLRVTMAARAAAPPPPPLPVRRTSPLIRPWFGVARGAEGFARVSFVWEAVELQPGARRRTVPPARIAMRVTTIDGTPVFEGVVDAWEAGSPATSLASFDAPEGRLRIEMSIEDAAASRLDTDVRDVLVDAPAGPLALGTAAVFRARTAREVREMRDDPRAVPTASRTFFRGEQLLIRLPVYADGGHADVSARLVSRAGRAMRTLTAEPGPLAGQQQFDLPLAGLPAGEYRLEVTAARDGRAVSDALDFRVVP